MKAWEFWRERPAFEAYNQARDLSPKTIQSYNQELKQFYAWFIEHHGKGTKITPRRIRAYIAARLARGNKRLTVRSGLIALRAFYSFLVKDQVIDDDQNPMRLVDNPRVSMPEIRPLTTEQTHHLLDSFERDRPVEYRNFVICLLILDTGLRVGEVVRLSVDDVDLGRSRILVNGKGRKRRVVYMGEKMEDILQDYIERHRPGIANGHRTLFPPTTRSTYATMRPHYLSEIIRKQMDKARIPRCNSSGHRLRHTFATRFVRAGGNVFALKKLLGHSKLEMTMRYVTLADEDLQEAARRASPVEGICTLDAPTLP